MLDAVTLTFAFLSCYGCDHRSSISKVAMARTKRLRVVRVAIGKTVPQKFGGPCRRWISLQHTSETPQFKGREVAIDLIGRKWNEAVLGLGSVLCG